MFATNKHCCTKTFNTGGGNQQTFHPFCRWTSNFAAHLRFEVFLPPTFSGGYIQGIAHHGWIKVQGQLALLSASLYSLHCWPTQSCRQELLSWLNNLLQLNVTKVEQCGTGYDCPLNRLWTGLYGREERKLIVSRSARAALCQIYDSIFRTYNRHCHPVGTNLTLICCRGLTNVESQVQCQHGICILTKLQNSSK